MPSLLHTSIVGVLLLFTLQSNKQRLLLHECFVKAGTDLYNTIFRLMKKMAQKPVSTQPSSGTSLMKLFLEDALLDSNVYLPLFIVLLGRICWGKETFFIGWWNKYVIYKNSKYKSRIVDKSVLIELNKHSSSVWKPALGTSSKNCVRQILAQEMKTSFPQRLASLVTQLISQIT